MPCSPELDVSSRIEHVLVNLFVGEGHVPNGSMTYPAADSQHFENTVEMRNSREEVAGES